MFLGEQGQGMENIPGGRLTKGPGLETVRQRDVARRRSKDGRVKRRAG